MDYENKILSVIKDVLEENKLPIKLYSSGQSMSPFIKPGDVLEVRPASFKDILSGDIAVFECGSSLCAHRLISKRSTKEGLILLTKSDHSFTADPPVKYESLLGKVALIQKKTKVLNLESFFWKLINRTLGIYHFHMSLLRERLRV